MTIEQVNVRRYSDAVAAYAAAVDKMLEAVAALQAKTEAMRAADPTTLHWGHAGSEAALANNLVDWLTKAASSAALSRLQPDG